ncbi:hypothetical protein MTR_7g015930 [Medicago truncatula]|uniref:Uncharacterized protein n=1 Tax=Medicago truncatula TaxID=3880 RepID=A0A072TWC3_MEDTR|nr:hypothetical protein MTR_7g015930 [Medicago truncatula]
MEMTFLPPAVVNCRWIYPAVVNYRSKLSYVIPCYPYLLLLEFEKANSPLAGV